MIHPLAKLGQLFLERRYHRADFLLVALAQRAPALFHQLRCRSQHALFEVLCLLLHPLLLFVEAALRVLQLRAEPRALLDELLQLAAQQVELRLQRIGTQQQVQREHQ